MTSLLELQHAFAAALRHGDAAAIAPLVVGNRLAPARRIAIYDSNVRENQLGALEAAFPALVRLAGRDWFRQSGRGYLRKHPSTSGNLSDLSEHFAAWLELELAEGPHAYFADVARLEGAYQDVQVAPEPGALDLAALAAVPTAQHATLVLELSSSARIVRSRWPLLAIWRMNQPDANATETVRLDDGPSRVLLVRRETHIELRELSSGEFAFLEAVSARACIADALAAALAADPAFELAVALPRFVVLGALTGFRLRHPSTPARSLET